MNQWVGMGRLTRDPELRHTQSNIPVASFTLAVDRGYQKDGDKQTDFINCVAWRGRAEFAAKWFSKGDMMAVTGRLQMRDWQDRGGNKRISPEIVVDNVYFTGSKKESGGNAYSDYDAPPVSDDMSWELGADKDSDFAELSDDDDELPF